MNLHFSFKAAKNPDLDQELQNHVRKLEKRLQVFRPDLIHLRGALETGPRDTFCVKLNLRLPSGQLSAQDNGDSAAAAIRVAFSDLLNQLRRHKELLRNGHKWEREKFPSGTDNPVAEIEAVVEHVMSSNEKLSQGNGKATTGEITAASFDEHNRPTVQRDVRAYVDANLPRLERFVARELRYLESLGQLQPAEVSRSEVVDEVVVTALSADAKPQQVALERWLYRLALQAIKRIALGQGDASGIPLEASVGMQNVTGSDESFLQFHQPGETLHREDIIADSRASTPEELAASDEAVDQFEIALHGSSKEAREAFVLFAIEGFTVEEIAEVTERGPKQVRELILQARERLVKKLPFSTLKSKLGQDSGVA